MLLSICIPTYNRATLLDQCLRSIVEQTHESLDYEIIVSDNNSNDTTEEVVRKYASITNLRYFKNEENIGAVRNILNLVGKYARGDYC